MAQPSHHTEPSRRHVGVTHAAGVPIEIDATPVVTVDEEDSPIQHQAYASAGMDIAATMCRACRLCTWRSLYLSVEGSILADTAMQAAEKDGAAALTAGMGALCTDDDCGGAGMDPEMEAERLEAAELAAAEQQAAA